MPEYKNGDYFVNKPNDASFDVVYPPGSTVPHSGIYKCEVCGREIVSTLNNTLPPASHHNHDPDEISWRLVAKPIHNATIQPKTTSTSATTKKS